MPELLLELFSEEIPARMQAQAAKDFERLVVGALSDRGLLFESARAFAGPRRLTLAITGLPGKQPDVSEERKGPRVGANEKAIEGFLKSARVTLDQCSKQSDAKGEFYVATISRKGRITAEVLSETLPKVIHDLRWPKNMRWPQEGLGISADVDKGVFWERRPLEWVRPLRAVLCTFDGETIPFMLADLDAGNTTRGHRFLSDGKAITVRRFDDYVDKLRSAYVVVDAAERRETILHEAKQKSFALGLELVEDEGLLNEVTGLAEWPVVLVGTIDAAFMDLPPEILQTTMRAHQKYFALRDTKTGKLANKFVVVANMVADDGGKAIVAGNERVLRARLSDAKFFWDQDRKRTLDSRVSDLAATVFHAKLGTQLERVDRIKALAKEIAKVVGADPVQAERAALLAKADLTTGVVGEFPELQGTMGRYYALADGEDKHVADAARDHYKPLGPRDEVPASPVSIAVALADKLDTLTGFFAIGEPPTGSGDPYALRRAALGYIRIVLDNNARVETAEMIESAHYWIQKTVHARTKKIGGAPVDLVPSEDCAEQLMDFFADRMKVALREKGTRHDLIDAVFSLGGEDIFPRLIARVEALQAFLKTDDGANLLTGYARAANILRIEEKKDKREYRGGADAKALTQDEERALVAALAAAKDAAAKALEAEDYAGAMSALAKLRAPVDRFFDKVTVNVDDKALRENRLKLLSQIVATAHQVADFSKIEGQ